MTMTSQRFGIVSFYEILARFLFPLVFGNVKSVSFLGIG